MSQNLGVGALTLTLSRECGFRIIGKDSGMSVKKVVVILGILLAGSLQATGICQMRLLFEKAESFIDAFYSFESESSRRFRVRSTSADSILYYQAWAKGGNYRL